MQKSTILSISLVSSFIFGCSISKSSSEVKNESSSDQRVVASVNEARYDASSNEAVLSVSYGGGCEEHEFNLEIDSSCLETLPAQCGAKLVQTKGFDDLCEAYITQEIRLSVGDIQKPVYLTIRGANDTSAKILIEDEETAGNDSESQINAAMVAEIRSATYDASTNEAIVSLIYGGGCKEHAFELKMNPVCLESYPAQCSAKLVQTKGFDDFCEALIPKKVRLPLEGIQKPAYLTIVGSNNSKATILVQ